MIASQTYRFAVYEHFARLMHERSVRWVVLHGAEEYPNDIGRDLDCLCASENDIRTALACFHEAAAAHPNTQWITYPHPIWGHRCVAVSSDYQAAELHILHELASGPIRHHVDYLSVDTAAVFPQEEAAFILKAIIMPLLGNSPKVLKTIHEVDIQILPACVRCALQHMQETGRISLCDRIRLYRHYTESLRSAAHSIHRSCINKIYRYLAHTVPVFYFDEHFRAEELENLCRQLSEIFLRIYDVSDLSQMAIKSLQSQQVFLYDRRAGHTSEALHVPILRGKELADYIVSSFADPYQTPRL